MIWQRIFVSRHRSQGLLRFEDRYGRGAGGIVVSTIVREGETRHPANSPQRFRRTCFLGFRRMSFKIEGDQCLAAKSGSNEINNRRDKGA
jgi:hypothetical protein